MRISDWSSDVCSSDLLNVMVHSAGVGVLKNVEDITVEEWHFVHNVNLHGPFLGIKHGLPRMRAHAPGSIVIISSVSGIIAGHNMSAYNTSKAAARMLAKTTALHRSEEHTSELQSLMR